MLFGGQPIVDPHKVPRLRERFRRPHVPELAYATSFYCPAGRWPCRGWFLMRRGDYNTINPYAVNLTLQINDFKNPPLSFTGLTVVQARCVTTGLPDDPDALYLVEVADARGILWNRWFQDPTASYYNVRAPAYHGDYYDGSLNAFVPWTWTGMIENLWNQMPLLGAYPGLPIAPVGTPENWMFPGVPVWPALCGILDHLGCNVACDLTKAAPYTIVSQGSSDAALTLLQSQHIPEDDMAWIDTGSGRVPAAVVVHFHRRNEDYGTEETVRLDSFQWAMRPFYTVPVSAPTFFAGAVGTHLLWDDFQVRYDIDGNPLAADVATAASIAADRASQYYNEIYGGTQGFMHQWYSGVLPFVTGSSVDGVCWKHRSDGKRAGWITEIVRGANPPWPEVDPMR